MNEATQAQEEEVNGKMTLAAVLGDKLYTMTVKELRANEEYKSKLIDFGDCCYHMSTGKGIVNALLGTNKFTIGNSISTYNTYKVNGCANILQDNDLSLTIVQACRKICKAIYKDCLDTSPTSIATVANYLCNNCGFEVIHFPSAEEAELFDLIKNDGCRQIILTGAPGTGKTHMAQGIAWAFSLYDDSSSSETVQFHPSYDYTDFMEGLRPVEINDQVTFKKMDGIFKAFCRKVVEDNKQKNPHYGEQGAAVAPAGLPLHFFIIDEINRADLSKVLGELMFCLEKDKRGPAHRIRTQYSNLPTYPLVLDEDCFRDGFYIPENVVIIGTMNDIDRSVESFDFALRRRFTWKEVEVTPASLKNALSASTFGLDQRFSFKQPANAISARLSTQIGKLNKKITQDGKAFGLNQHYFISQGHFTDLPDSLFILTDKEKGKVEEQAKGKDDDKERFSSAAVTEKICNYVWDHRIRNILYEYVRGSDEKKAEAFLKSCKPEFTIVKLNNTGKDPVDEADSKSVAEGDE